MVATDVPAVVSTKSPAAPPPAGRKNPTAGGNVTVRTLETLVFGVARRARARAATARVCGGRGGRQHCGGIGAASDEELVVGEVAVVAAVAP